MTLDRRREIGGRRKEKSLRPLVFISALFLLPSSSFLLTTTATRGAVQDRPLPNPDTFYRHVRENLGRAQQAVHLYAYRERRTDVHANPFGRVGTGGRRVFDVYPSANPQLAYRRLIERNGVRVSAAELARQDGEYRAKAAEVQRRLATRGADERQGAEAESARARQQGRRMIDDVIETLDFKLDRRTTYEGVPAIVVLFTPQPNARPATREGRIAQRFAGTVWIHEAAAEVMRVEAKSTDDISFGFGIIARLGEGTTVTLTRRPVERGVWMPTALTLEGRGRAVLFRRLVLDYAIEWFNYRRLPEDLQAPFLDPRVQDQAGGRPE